MARIKLLKNDKYSIYLISGISTRPGINENWSDSNSIQKMNVNKAFLTPQSMSEKKTIMKN